MHYCASLERVGCILLLTRPYARQHQSRAGGQDGSWAGSVAQIYLFCSKALTKAKRTDRVACRRLKADNEEVIHFQVERRKRFHGGSGRHYYANFGAAGRRCLWSVCSRFAFRCLPNFSLPSTGVDQVNRDSGL